MTIVPFPVFFSINDILDLEPDNLERELPEMIACLNECSSDAAPQKGYNLVKLFLQANASPTRYDHYRVCVERLLLWSLLVIQKPIFEMDSADISRFMDFCLLPPSDWVASRVQKRLIRTSTKRSNKSFRINNCWRPFRGSSRCSPTIGKLSAGSSLGAQLKIIYLFYKFLCDFGHLNYNPAAPLHNAKIFPATTPIHSGNKCFSEMEWSYLVAVAEDMARSDQEFERKLFLLMSMYYLYLQPVDLDRYSKSLQVKSLFLRPDGNYGLRCAEDPEFAKLIIEPEYINNWLLRFRTFLGTSTVPLERDPTPLVSTQSGRPGISSRHANLTFKAICNAVVNRLELEGVTVPPESPFRIASLLWIRETKLVHSARKQPFWEVYSTLRSTTLDTAYARFFAWQRTP